MAQTFDPATMETAHRCPGCGRTVTTRDAGVYQAPAPRQINPLRAVGSDDNPTLREMAQRARRSREQVRADWLGAAGRRV